MEKTDKSIKNCRAAVSGLTEVRIGCQGTQKEGVRTVIIGSECNTEIVPGFTVLWEKTQ